MSAEDGKSLPTEEEEEPVEEKQTDYFPSLDLAQKAYLLEAQDIQVDTNVVKSELLAEIERNAMTPFYHTLCERHNWTVDSQLAQSMSDLNAKELDRLKEALADAEENHGETEVMDALFEIARFHARTGAKTEAYEAFQVILDKPKVSTGKKIDANMQKLRVALFHMDTETFRALLENTKKLVDDGGDWDRRNRLKVYEAFFLMVERDFKAAAALLLEGIATFTCVELCDYETFIKYAVITNLLYLDRPTLKKKIVEGPEVLGIIPQLAPLPALVNGLYDCDYKSFFSALVDLNSTLLSDRYLAPHAKYLIREYRILVYSQFLEAYKSVMLSTMAAAFGVSMEFLDKELSRFISANRLNAKIDKVGGMVETSRADRRNAQYQTVIKKGDLLLNRIQKLARVIDA